MLKKPISLCISIVLRNTCTTVCSFLEEGMAQGVIRKDLNIEVVSFLLQDSNRTFIDATRLTNKTFSNWELFFTSMINFIRGISSADGIKIVDKFLTKYYSDINV